jgi:hypothetical protein
MPGALRPAVPRGGRAPGLALATVTAAAAVLVAAAAPASAHHGFTGEYHASAPLYVHGTVQSATYGYPHGLIHITPGPAVAAPADLQQLSSREQVNLGGLDVVTTAAPVSAEGDGQLTLLLPPPMTTEVAARGDRPEAGAQVGALVFRECTTGELRVQLLRISAQQHVVRSGVMQTEVQGCPGGSARTGQPAATASAPVAVATVREPSGAPWPLIAGLGVAGAVVTGGLLVAASRRHGGAS